MAITISDISPRIQYTATSGQTSFTVPFEFFDDDDLVVVNTSSGGVDTILTKAASPSSVTQYSVTGAGVTGGGSITLGSGATLNDKYTITRNVPIARSTDFATTGVFPIDSLNTELDKLVAMMQQQGVDINLSPRASSTTSTAYGLIFPELVSDKVLSVNSNGNGLIFTQELGVYKGNWSASTSYVQRDLVKDTSTNNIFICLSGHTSSGSQPLTTNTDSAKWSLIVDAASATTSATAAATSATAAATSASASATSATAAASSETDAQTAQTAAETAQTAAETAKTAAETAKTNAETSETNAATSETNAANSATAAATSATNSANSASAASTSETNAANSATAAAASAVDATNNGATQVALATTQATNAATSATNAATSETNAATSASNASTSETNAANSATSAGTSATSATTSATNASNSATAAANSAAAAANSFDDFDDKYLGSKTSDPTVDNDGNALVSGALYFNSNANEMRVYDGANWIAASSAGTASLILYEYTATSGQTTFSGSDDNSATLSYSVDNLQVVLNGVILDPSDYTATSGTSIVLGSGAATGDLLNVYAFKSFTVSELNANNLNDGIIPDARFPATLPAISGANLTNLDASDLASGTVPIARIGASGTKDSTTFFRGDNTFATVTIPAGTTINNNADNRVITGSGTANTLEGEANLTFDGTNLDMGDSKKIRLGASQDLQIYHDGSNSFIQDAGTGSLVLQGTNLLIRTNNGDNVITATENAEVTLAYDNATKLQTTSTGVDVTGALTVNGAALAGGKIAQVVSTTKRDTFSTSSSSFTDISGMSVSITPSSSSSKILVSVQLSHGGAVGLHAHGKLLRNGSSIAEGNGASGQMVNATIPLQTDGSTTADRYVKSSAMNYLDSPNTTSSTTYKMQVRAVNFNGNGTSFKLNRPDTNSNDVGAGYYVSTITVMEVLA